jgi:predicted transposase YdaD
MKTDKLIYSIFQESPETALALLGYDEALFQHYAFQSIEVKEISYRIDGVLLPDSTDLPVIILEVQFQTDEFIYERILSETLIFRAKNRQFPQTQMVVMFASRNLDKGAGMFSPLVTSGAIRPIYLNEALNEETRNLGQMLIQLTVKKSSLAADLEVAKSFKQILEQPEIPYTRKRFFLNLLINVFLEKHEPLTYQELEAMIEMEEIFDFSNNRLVHDIARHKIAPAIAKEMAEDMAKDLAKDLAKDIAKDMAKDLAKDMAKDLAKDMAKDIAKDMAKDLAKDIAKEMAKDIAQEMARAKQLAEIPALRRFGLTNEQIAEALQLSLEDVQRVQ